jgi:hypothetical protein
MKLIIKIWNDPVLSKVIAGIILLIISSLSSKLFTNNWFMFFEFIPIEIWLILLFSFIIYIIIKMFLKSRKYKKPASSFEVLPLRDWQELYQKIQYDVIWVIRKQQGDVFDIYLGDQTDPEDLNIKIPPYCPKCNTELEEKKTILGSYLWFCVKCDFSKKSKMSFYIIADAVRKIEQSEYRKFLINRDS